MKLKCQNCGEIFKIPDGNCPICFGDHLGRINDIKDKEERFYKLSEFINNLTDFDYKRGLHNGKCVYSLEMDCWDEEKFREVEE